MSNPHKLPLNPKQAAIVSGGATSVPCSPFKSAEPLSTTDLVKPPPKFYTQAIGEDGGGLPDPDMT